MPKLLLVTVLITLALAASAFAQPDTLWTKIFGATNDDYCYHVEQTSDGGFIMTGRAEGHSSFYHAPLIKTDINGNLQWFKNFSYSGYNEGTCVQPTIDGGYILTGYFGSGVHDAFLIKTDFNGHVQWSRAYGSYGNEWGLWVQQTTDGGYIFTGMYANNVWLVKTDALGNEQWENNYGGNLSDVGYCVQQTFDGGYIITGSTYINPFNYQVFLIKTDNIGNEIWNRNFGGSADDQGREVQQTIDGGYIIVGHTQSYGAGQKDVYLIKTDIYGNIQWERTFGGIEADWGRSVQQTNDNGYIIAGYTWSYGAGYYDFWLIKTDTFGNILWEQTYGGIYNDLAECVRQTDDGGYIVAGTTYSHVYLDHPDALLIRLAAETPLSVSLTPYHPPIQIPSGGGSFNFDCLVANDDTIPHTFDGWLKVVLPNGSIISPLSLRTGFTLAPGEDTLWTSLSQYVPASAPGGEYTYIACAGFFEDSVIASGSFHFEKLPGDGSSADDTGWAVYGWGEESHSILDSQFLILNCTPNPFNQSTVISFELSEASFVNLTICDITGREVARLIDGQMTTGSHRIVFDGSNLSSGIYFARLQASGFVKTQKLLLIK